MTARTPTPRHRRRTTSRRHRRASGIQATPVVVSLLVAVATGMVAYLGGCQSAPPQRPASRKAKPAPVTTAADPAETDETAKVGLVDAGDAPEVDATKTTPAATPTPPLTPTPTPIRVSQGSHASYLDALAQSQHEPPLGNVFLTTDAVRIPVKVTSGTVTYRITDYWQKTVAEGELSDSHAAIERPSTEGYYFVHLGNKPYTSFAVVSPHAVRDNDASPFGVMTHFAQGFETDMFELIRKAGIVSIRDEHYWGHVEKKRGVYKFPEYSDPYMTAAKEHEIDPLVAMTFGNKLYDHEQGPSTPDGFAGYARYGEAILKRFGKQVKWLEIWNEYNGSWCPPQAHADRPKCYTEMIKATYQHIKKLRPDVKILGCACVLIPIGYLEGIFKYGGLDYMDAVVIHPYRGQPEGVDEDVAELEALIRKYNKGRDKGIWVTETGRYDHGKYDWEKAYDFCEKGRAEVARYLPRQYTLLLKSGNVEKVYWYLLRDHHNFKTMGLLRRPGDKLGRYAVAPAYVSYAVLIRMLEGAKHVRRETTRPYTRAYVELFQRAGEQVRVCWSTMPSRVEFSASRPLRMVNMMGVETTLTPTAGKVTLDLTGDPVYVIGRVAKVTEVVTGARILGDSDDDFSKTQGKKNWYYGYYDGDGKGSGNGAAPSGAYTDDDWEELEQEQTMWGYTWKGPAQYMNLNHPQYLDGKQAWIARRWKSPLAGRVHLKGTYDRGKQGDGIESRILVDGAEVYKQHVGGPRSPENVAFDLTIDVKLGTLVDFCITPGPPGANIQYDGTGFSVRITEAEETR